MAAADRGGNVGTERPAVQPAARRSAGLGRRWRASRMAPPRRDPYGLDVAWVAVDGRAVKSLSAGMVSDTPELVFQPGLGAPGYLVPWLRRTALWTKATLLDLPGWRGGRARASPATLEAVAAVAARWLEITDRRDVVLVGHSTGAQAALRAALLIPERVTGVVLAGPSFDPVTRSLPRSVLGAVATLPREPIGAAEVAVPSYLHSGGVQLLRFVRSALAYRCEDHLPELAAPVVLLTAEHDPFSSPAWVAEMARSVGAPWHVLAGAHMSQYGRPDAADKLVRETVRGWFGRARTKPESYTGSSS